MFMEFIVRLLILNLLRINPDVCVGMFVYANFDYI